MAKFAPEATDVAAGPTYWRKQAWSELSTLRLPFENPVPPKAGFDPQQLPIRQSADSLLAEKVNRVARNYHVLPAILWQSCWHILLWRYCNQPNLIVGLAADGRISTELQEAMGLMTRYLPVGSYLEDDTTLAQLLGQLNRAAQEAYARQEFFNWEHAAALSSPGELDFLPFSFEFVELPAPINAAGVTFSLEQTYVCSERFKLKLVVWQSVNGISADLHFDALLFAPTDVQRLAGELAELIASATSQPEAAIGALNFVTPAERRQLLVDFNQTEADFPVDRCIHHLFEFQVGRVPDRPAVMFEGQGLTYAELNRRANQLAHYLQSLGVGPETLVAVFVERSLDMIVGMLGVLKAGGAYVPFDPTLPQERLAFLLDDTQVPVLLTQQHLTERLAPRVNLNIIRLDADGALIDRQPDHNPASPVQSSNLAYVLFTSGSTGQPKGVMVEHRQLLNYLHSITTKLKLPAEANYATVSTFAADLGNTVIFPALCGGGCLHIITHERATDPDALAAYFNKYEIDCLKLVPSHLGALFASARPEQNHASPPAGAGW